MNSPATVAPRRNVELKVALQGLDEARRAARALATEPSTVQLQVDTYFQAPQGRLKLREISGQPGVLIAYSRPDEAVSRLSQYYLVPVADSDLLRTALTAALGVRVQVRKRREIVMWHNVRIHLDEVEQLGTYGELEAVLPPDMPESQGHEQVAWLAAQLGFDRATRVTTSYSDLLLAAQSDAEHFTQHRS